jgi:hypothetical protein
MLSSHSRLGVSTRSFILRRTTSFPVRTATFRPNNFSRFNQTFRIKCTVRMAVQRTEYGICNSYYSEECGTRTTGHRKSKPEDRTH